MRATIDLAEGVGATFDDPAWAAFCYARSTEQMGRAVAMWAIDKWITWHESASSSPPPRSPRP